METDLFEKKKKIATSNAYTWVELYLDHYKGICRPSETSWYNEFILQIAEDLLYPNFFSNPSVGSILFDQNQHNSKLINECESFRNLVLTVWCFGPRDKMFSNVFFQLKRLKLNERPDLHLLTTLINLCVILFRWKWVKEGKKFHLLFLIFYFFFI